MQLPLVVVVEEDGRIAESLTGAQPHRPYCVGSARSGEELREALRGACPAVVVVRMARRFVPAAAWLLEHRPGTPLVLVADHWERDLSFALLGLGVTACIAWPEDTEYLTASVQQVLAGPGRPGRAAGHV
jgi:DNA-binding NarL/FixJ family response regulator